MPHAATASSAVAAAADQRGATETRADRPPSSAAPAAGTACADRAFPPPIHSRVGQVADLLFLLRLLDGARRGVGAGLVVAHGCGLGGGDGVEAKGEGEGGSVALGYGLGRWSWMFWLLMLLDRLMLDPAKRGVAQMKNKRMAAIFFLRIISE